MRILATIALSLVVMIASLVFLAYSACAVNGGFNGGGNRMPYIGGALIALAVIIGGAYGVNRVNRRKME
jgi:hypothetical protein